MRNLGHFTLQLDQSTEMDQLSKPWQLYTEIHNFKINMKYRELVHHYQRKQNQILEEKSAWILATIIYVFAGLKIGIKDLNFGNVPKIWDKLKNQEKQYLWDLMAEIQMEYAIRLRGKKYQIHIFNTYFKNPEVKPYYYRRFQMKKFYYKAILLCGSGSLKAARQTLQQGIKIVNNQQWNLKFSNRLGIVLGQQGEFSNATSILAEVLTQSTSKRFSFERAYAFNILAILASNKGDKQQAKSYAKYCIDICDQNNFLVQKLSILHNLSRILFQEGKFNDALTNYMFLAQEHRRLGNMDKYANALIAQGAIYGRIGKFDLAEKKLKMVDGLGAYISNEQRLINQFNQMIMLLELGRWNEINKKIQEYEPILEEHDSTSMRARHLLLRFKLDFFENLDRINENEINQLIKLLQKEQNYDLLSWFYYYAAAKNELKGNLYNSNKYMEKALLHARHINHPVMIVEFLIYYMHLLNQTDQYEELRNCFNEIKEIYLIHPYEMISNYYEIAKLLIKSSDYLKANSKDDRIIDLREDLDHIFKNFIHSPTMNYKIKEYILQVLLEFLVNDDIIYLGLKEYRHEILEEFHSMADLNGSKYLQTTIFLGQAKLAIKEKDHGQAYTCLKHARDLALQGGFSHKIDHITYYELKLSQAMA